ncbi:MAG: hypothetical protein PHG39_07370 [Acidithiobacillus ferrooxidans]|nr:hypothetical protein [Acidithiobacillus ferrooxidans]MDD5379005.1 hypothetical protein [Acidithiobacillus sp.]MDD5575750.1 hypothetical protein [Acidithiobacillus sp.]
MHWAPTFGVWRQTYGLAMQFSHPAALRALSHHARLSRLAQVRTSVRADLMVASSMPSLMTTAQRSLPFHGSG